MQEPEITQTPDLKKVEDMEETNQMPMKMQPAHETTVQSRNLPDCVQKDDRLLDLKSGESPKFNQNEGIYLEVRGMLEVIGNGDSNQLLGKVNLLEMLLKNSPINKQDVVSSQFTNEELLMLGNQKGAKIPAKLVAGQLPLPKQGKPPLQVLTKQTDPKRSIDQEKKNVQPVVKHKQINTRKTDGSSEKTSGKVSIVTESTEKNQKHPEKNLQLSEVTQKSTPLKDHSPKPFLNVEKTGTNISDKKLPNSNLVQEKKPTAQQMPHKGRSDISGNPSTVNGTQGASTKSQMDENLEKKKTQYLRNDSPSKHSVKDKKNSDNDSSENKSNLYLANKENLQLKIPKKVSAPPQKFATEIKAELATPNSKVTPLETQEPAIIDLDNHIPTPSPKIPTTAPSKTCPITSTGKSSLHSTKVSLLKPETKIKSRAPEDAISIESRQTTPENLKEPSLKEYETVLKNANEGPNEDVSLTESTKFSKNALRKSPVTKIKGNGIAKSNGSSLNEPKTIKKPPTEERPAPETKKTLPEASKKSLLIPSLAPLLAKRKLGLRRTLEEPVTVNSEPVLLAKTNKKPLEQHASVSKENALSSPPKSLLPQKKPLMPRLKRSSLEEKRLLPTPEELPITHTAEIQVSAIISEEKSEEKSTTNEENELSTGGKETLGKFKEDISTNPIQESAIITKYTVTHQEKTPLTSERRFSLTTQTVAPKKQSSLLPAKKNTAPLERNRSSSFKKLPAKKAQKFRAAPFHSLSENSEVLTKTDEKYRSESSSRNLTSKRHKMPLHKMIDTAQNMKQLVPLEGNMLPRTKHSESSELSSDQPDQLDGVDDVKYSIVVVEPASTERIHSVRSNPFPVAKDVSTEEVAHDESFNDELFPNFISTDKVNTPVTNDTKFESPILPDNTTGLTCCSPKLLDLVHTNDLDDDCKTVIGTKLFGKIVPMEQRLMPRRSYFVPYSYIVPVSPFVATVTT